MSQLSELLEEEARLVEPGQAREDAAWKRLRGAMLVGAAPSVPEPASVVASTGTAAVGKWVVVMSIVGTVVLGGLFLGRADDERPAVPTPQPAEVVVEDPLPARDAPPTEDIPVQAVQSDPPPAETAPEPPPRRERPRAPAADLVEETKLVRAGWAALAEGDLARARGEARAHAKRFPRGELRLERKQLELAIGCARGAKGARAKAEAFLETHPSAIHAAVVRRKCGG